MLVRDFRVRARGFREGASGFPYAGMRLRQTRQRVLRARPRFLHACLRVAGGRSNGVGVGPSGTEAGEASITRR
jgi:hypothetical protein